MSQDSQTPMMKAISRHPAELPPHTILMFRLGDFYEMFNDDAKGRVGTYQRRSYEARRDADVRRAVPRRARIRREAHRRRPPRGICDQVGEVQAGKLVRREVSRVISPGTLDDFGLDDRAPNYLARRVRDERRARPRLLRSQHRRIPRDRAGEPRGAARRTRAHRPRRDSRASASGGYVPYASGREPARRLHFRDRRGVGASARSFQGPTRSTASAAPSCRRP